MMPSSNDHSGFIDLSHAIENGMITYRGLPSPKIYEYWSRAYSRQFYNGETEFHIGKIEMVANTGTYLDSPFHRFMDGMDLSQLPLSSLANLEGVLVELSNLPDRKITQDLFSGIDVKDKAVLIHTGWDRHWGTENYFEGHPYLTREAATYLAESEARLVGIDSLNIDDTADGLRPAHTILLEANIPIVEHLCALGRLPKYGFHFFAVPAKVVNFGSFPVRAFAIIDQFIDKDS
jgi:kynurenine formamidase